jgi:hypothetical protein
VLQLSESGEEIARQEENKLMEKVENKVKTIFSDRDTKIIYFLFTKERVSSGILSLLKRSNVETLIEVGLIDEKEGLFLQFDENSPIHRYIYSGIDSNEMRRWLKEKCETILTGEEKLLLGFLSGCKNVVLEKYKDWRSWSSVTSRTQRKYESAYKSLFISFPYLRKLFSLLTGLSTEQIDMMTSKLEENGFLLREKIACDFPGHALIYRIPVKFDFELDMSIMRPKIKEYIRFLTENLEDTHNQLIFLNYLIQFYEKYRCDFIVNSSLIEEHLLNLLNYTPPAEYSPIYAIEDKMIVLHPLIKDELKREIYELKTRLIEPLKNVLRHVTEEYQNNITYNYSEKAKVEGYFILEVESPDPSVGTISFVIAPWITPLDVQEISSLCIKSNTVNLFVVYPNYPQLKSMITTNGRYNLVIVRNENIYLFLKKADQVTQSIFSRLSEQFKVIKKEEKLKREIEELQEKYPNISKVRFIIPEIEEKLRDAIRPRLKIEFGENWEDKIRQRFPHAEKNKQKWEKEHPGEKRDVLQGVSIGDFKTLFEDRAFSFLKDCFKNFSLVKTSLQVFLRKKVYHHGRPKNGKDISDEEVDVLNTAYRTLSEMVKS